MEIKHRLRTVGTLNVGSPKCQVVGALIVRFSEHQQRNVNPDYMTSWASEARCKLAKKGWSDNGGPTISPMIKLAKIWRVRRE